ncbi:hypothetical protein FJZ22_00525 [Candidatus Pacearchaeota archaeon]|nr:hypothetical protein [Candidatus Pacearchaeota archaeon]
MALGRKAVRRLHHQYVLFDSSSQQEIEQRLLEGIGLLGWARAQPVVQEVRGKIVVAIHPTMVQDVRAAALLCSPPLSVLAVSGTLAGLGRKT